MIFGTRKAPKHTESWNSYFTSIEGYHASIFLDLGFLKIAPVPKFTTLLAIGMQYFDYDDNGLPTSEEAEALFTIEDRLVKALHEETGALFVGRKTYHMQREFYFYCADTAKEAQKEKQVVEDVFSQFPDYAISLDWGEDAQWQHYLERLYPSEEERQTMNNMSLLSALVDNGDDLKKKRMVKHWCYFRGDNVRALFKGEIESQGFEVVGEHLHEDGTELPYEIAFQRKNKIGFQYVNELTLPLFHLAKKYNGYYDGWEVELQKARDET